MPLIIMGARNEQPTILVTDPYNEETYHCSQDARTLYDFLLKKIPNKTLDELFELLQRELA